MTLHSHLMPRVVLRRLKPFLLSTLFIMALSPAALAAPGAHGPNGEHLDAPSGTAQGSGSSNPRFEMRSDLFEAVGTLNDGELQIFINRFATNEPVLSAKVEVETGALRAEAVFQEDLGDYAVAEPALLEALRAEGEHAIVMTVLAGDDADLLDATLTTPAAGHGHDHHVPAWIWIAGLGLFVAAGGWFLWRSRRSPRLAGASR